MIDTAAERGHWNQFWDGRTFPTDQFTRALSYLDEIDRLNAEVERVGKARDFAVATLTSFGVALGMEKP